MPYVMGGISNEFIFNEKFIEGRRGGLYPENV